MRCATSAISGSPATTTTSKTRTEALPRRNAAVRTVVGMEQTENGLHRLLQLVESAQRAGHSEDEITTIVDEALEADAELDAAA